MAQNVCCWSLAEETGFDPRLGHVEFMWTRVVHEQSYLQILCYFLTVSHPFTKATFS
jgi:hypothetical protein